VAHRDGLQEEKKIEWRAKRPITVDNGMCRGRSTSRSEGIDS